VKTKRKAKDETRELSEHYSVIRIVAANLYAQTKKKEEKHRNRKKPLEMRGHE